MQDLPTSEMPRERMARFGPDPLPDTELLAIVLGTGSARAGAPVIARELLRRFRDLRRLAGASVGELTKVPGVGFAQACRVKAALALASRLHERPPARGDRLSTPEQVAHRLGPPLVDKPHEVFVAVALDVKNRVLAETRIAEGGVCSVEIVMRDAFVAAVREGAAAVVFVHNHPSGDPAPSAADRELTRRLREAGTVVGIPVLDHVIVAQGGMFAFSADAAWGRGE